MESKHKAFTIIGTVLLGGIITLIAATIVPQEQAMSVLSVGGGAVVTFVLIILLFA